MIFKKYFLARLRTVKFGLGCATTLIIAAPVVCFLFGLLKNDMEVRLALADGMLWTAYAILVILFIYTIYLINASGYVVFYNNILYYYRWLFSKRKLIIPCDKITECIAANGIRVKGDKHVCTSGTILYNCGRELIKFESNHKLLYELYDIVGDAKFRLTGDNGRLKTIDAYYKVDYSSLNPEQKMFLLKTYCNPSKSKELDGKSLLKKKGLM